MDPLQSLITVFLIQPSEDVVREVCIVIFKEILVFLQCVPVRHMNTYSIKYLGRAELKISQSVCFTATFMKLYVQNNSV